MSLTREESTLLDTMATPLTVAELGAVAEIMDELDLTLGSYKVKAAVDDRLAKLEAAVIQYIVSSRKPEFNQGWEDMTNKLSNPK